MRFRILGPLEFWSGEGWTAVGPAQWRSLLGCLLLRRGQLVSVESLTFELWGDSPPDKASNLVSIYAHRLRRLIGDPDGEVLIYRPPGYLLRIGPGDLDLQDFESLVDNGRNALAADPETAAALLTKALTLWRGPLLSDVEPTSLVSAEAERAGELRLAATELRIEADLACGRSIRVIAELRGLVAENPIREGLWLLLVRALDEAGRHAEALDTYARARKVIGEELGVEPGTELRRLYAELLAANAAAVAPGPARARARVNGARGSGATAGSQAAVARPADDRAASRRAAGVTAAPAPGSEPGKVARREDFGRELDAARVRAGMTVRKAARLAGISPGMAAGYFAGRDIPGLSETGLKTLRALLGACGITDPEQVITWTYALTRAWAPLGSPPPVPAERHRSKPAGQDGNRPAPAVPDAPGFDLCPDPLTARTAAEFVTALSQFRIWAGEPSFREMERLSDPKVASATMCTALGGDKLVPGSCKLPSQRVVRAIVTACGGTPGHLEAFITARRMIRMKQAPGAQAPQANRAALYPVPDAGNPARTA